jgi:chromosome segregation ATPase
MKRLKELTDELNTEKRRNNDLLKEKSDREREIQILHAQLDSIQYKPEPTSPHSQQNIQTLELQLKRVAEENIHLNHQLAQQQQLTTSNLTNTGDLSNMKVQVLSEQIKKLSVDNANLEKKANSNESLAKEAQKEKERLIGYENTFVETFFSHHRTYPGKQIFSQRSRY